MFTLVIARISIRRSTKSDHKHLCSFYLFLPPIFFSSWTEQPRKKSPPFHQGQGGVRKSNKFERIRCDIFIVSHFFPSSNRKRRVCSVSRLENANFIVRHASSICAIFEDMTVVKSTLFFLTPELWLYTEAIAVKTDPKELRRDLNGSHID